MDLAAVVAVVVEVINDEKGVESGCSGDEDGVDGDNDEGQITKKKIDKKGRWRKKERKKIEAEKKNREKR